MKVNRSQFFVKSSVALTVFGLLGSSSFAIAQQVRSTQFYGNAQVVGSWKISGFGCPGTLDITNVQNAGDPMLANVIASGILPHFGKARFICRNGLNSSFVYEDFYVKRDGNSVSLQGSQVSDPQNWPLDNITLTINSDGSMTGIASDGANPVFSLQFTRG